MKRFHMRPQTQETIAGRRATGTACSQIPQKNRKLEMPEVHAPSLTDTTNKKFEDLQNDPEALKNIMEKNPAEYERLLNDYIKRNGK